MKKLTLMLTLLASSIAFSSNAISSPSKPTFAELKLKLENYQREISRYPKTARSVFAKLDALDLGDDRKLLSIKEDIYRYYGFYTNGVRIDNRQENPRVCVHFSRQVRPEPMQEWKKLITVKPALKTQWQYQGSALCFSGEWQTQYTISLDEKLESNYRLPLYKAPEKRVFNISTGLRYPMVRFTSQATVLDVERSSLIPIQLANMAKANIALWRIPANNLANPEVRNLIENPSSQEWGIDSLLRNNAESIYTGVFENKALPLNKTVTRNIDIKKIAPQAKAGVYVLKVTDADSEDYAKDTALKVFTLSTDGISAYITPDGLWAELRALKSADINVEKELVLYAKDNQILGRAKTDRKGVAYFPKSMLQGKDGAVPSHLVYETLDTLAYLSLNGSGIDLSTKGLSGERSDKTLAAWIWQDRGVYRQNDTAHLMWLLKDKKGQAFDKAPVWVNILRPDGRSVLSKAIHADKSGSYRVDYHFAKNAWLGDWRIRLSLAKDGSGFIKQQVIPVSAVMPQQIGVRLKADQKTLVADKKARFTLNANWLYGAPAKDLTGQARWTYLTDVLSAQYADYQVGLFDQKLTPKTERKNIDKTDAKGESIITLALNDVPFSTKPLALRLNTSIATPSGQSIERQYAQRVTRKHAYVAIKVEDKSAHIALLNDDEQLVKDELEWKLYRRHFNYYWYRTDGWHYQSNENRTLVHQGKMTTDTKKESILNLPLDDGQWVLEVKGKANESATSVPIEYGAYTSHELDQSPDLIQITTDKERYQNGEHVKVHLTAPFDGPASLKLAQDGILSNRVFRFVDGKAELSLIWQKAWDKGVWLLVSAWNEKQAQATHKRAVGLSWLGGNLDSYSIPLSVDLDKEVRPKQALTVPLSIPKEHLGDDVWAQVAIVDDALYQLAAPSFTSPLDTFMGKKQLDMRMYDVWGRIITPMQAREVAVRQGAGANAMMARSKLAEMADSNGLPDPEVTLDLKLYTYWSEPVRFDEEGQAQVTFDIPETNTQFRVMALVWDKKRMGTKETTFKVKSPLVAQIYMAPFLTLNDRAEIKVRLNNTTSQPMKLRMDLVADAHLETSEIVISPELYPSEEMWFTMPYKAIKAGRSTVRLDITGDETVSQTFSVDIRPVSALTLNRKVEVIKPNASIALKPEPDVERMTMTAFAHAPIDVEKLVKALSYYPYGCVEQTVSRGWNNLLYPDLTNRNDQPQNLVTSSQVRLVNMQSYDGSFSLWGDSEYDIWLTAYVADYLLSLKEAQRLDTDFMLDSALKYLRSVVFNTSLDELTSANSYAHRVLAQSGASTQGALLRYIESISIAPRLSAASLDTALALIYHGEIERSATLLAKISDTEAVTSSKHYGSPLRDLAQALVLNQKIKQEVSRLDIRSNALQESLDQIENTLWTDLSSALLQTSYSTQEMHWLTMLAKNLPEIVGTRSGTLVVNGQNVAIHDGTELYKANRSAEALTQTVTNKGADPAYVITDSWSRQKGDIENGVSVKLTYLDAYTGKEVAMKKVKHNQLIAVHADISLDASIAKSEHDIMFSYPLPVGFTSVKMTYSAASNFLRNLKLKQAHARFEQDRDATHIAAFRTYQNQSSVSHIFFVRASRVGDWYAPSYQVQDMYNPNVQAKYKGVNLVVVDE